MKLFKTITIRYFNWRLNRFGKSKYFNLYEKITSAITNSNVDFINLQRFGYFVMNTKDIILMFKKISKYYLIHFKIKKRNMLGTLWGIRVVWQYKLKKSYLQYEYTKIII